MKDQVEASIVVRLAAKPVIVECFDDGFLLAAYQRIVVVIVFVLNVEVTQKIHDRGR